MIHSRIQMPRRARLAWAVGLFALAVRATSAMSEDDEPARGNQPPAAILLGGGASAGNAALTAGGAKVDTVSAAQQLEQERMAKHKEISARGGSAAEHKAADDEFLKKARAQETVRKGALNDLAKEAGVGKIEQGGHGTQPEQGRGITGDVDTDSYSAKDYEKIRKAAQDKGYRIKPQGDSFTIEELNTTVHREGSKYRSPSGSSARESELARGGGKETSRSTTFDDPNIKVMDNLGKSGGTMTKPTETMQSGDWQELGKMTGRNLDTAGMAEKYPGFKEKCDLLKQGYRPESVGITDMAEFQRQCQQANKEALQTTRSQASQTDQTLKTKVNEAQSRLDELRKAPGADPAEVQNAKQAADAARQDLSEFRQAQKGAQDALTANQPDTGKRILEETKPITGEKGKLTDSAGRKISSDGDVPGSKKPIYDAQGNPIASEGDKLKIKGGQAEGASSGTGKEIVGPDGKPLGGEPAQAAGGKQILGPDGQPVRSGEPPAKPTGKEILGPDGKPVGGAPETTAGTGKEILGPDGKPLKPSEATGKSGGKEVLGPDGKPASGAAESGGSAKDLLGPDGQPIKQADGTGKAGSKTLYGPDGKPVSGAPEGTAGAGKEILGPDQKPIKPSEPAGTKEVLGPDGKPTRSTPETTSTRQPSETTGAKEILGSDGKPLKPSEATGKSGGKTLVDAQGKPLGGTEPAAPGKTGGKGVVEAPAKPVPEVPTEPAGGSGKTASGTRAKVFTGLGVIVMIDQLYHGYQKAKEEVDRAQKPGQPETWGDTTKKGLLTLWHGLGIGGAWETGRDAGNKAMDEYHQGVKKGTIDPNSYQSWGAAKLKGTLNGVGTFIKAITFDFAWDAGTKLGDAAREGVGAAKSTFDAFQAGRGANATADALYDKFIKAGFSPEDAQKAREALIHQDTHTLQELRTAYREKTGAGSGLKEAEPTMQDAASDSAGSRSLLDKTISGLLSAFGSKNADALDTLKDKDQLDKASNIGNQQMADARATKDAAGRSAQDITDKAATDTAKGDRETSWGTTLGDALADGVKAGGTAAGAAIGAGAAQEVGDKIFDGGKKKKKKDDKDSDDADPDADGSGSATNVSGQTTSASPDETTEPEEDSSDDQSDDTEDGQTTAAAGATAGAGAGAATGSAAGAGAGASSGDTISVSTGDSASGGGNAGTSDSSAGGYSAAPQDKTIDVSSQLNGRKVTGVKVTLTYDAYTIPDTFQILYEGQGASSGSVSGSGTIGGASPGSSPVVTIRVLSSSDQTTKWTWSANVEFSVAAAKP